MKYIHIIFITFISFININAQCYPDRHNTNWMDAWVSCEMSANPNPDHEASHWIMYDLGISYKLGESHFWNINEPKHLDDGIKRINVDYSIDGVNWRSLGVFDLAKASGRSVYEGNEGPDFDQNIGRYVLLTSIENYGGDCTGLSEIKINVEKISTSVLDDEISSKCLDVKISPNPFWQEANISLKSYCEGDIRYIIYDMLGKPVLSGEVQMSAKEEMINIPGADLKGGAYVIQLIQNNQVISKSFFKLNNYK